MSDVTFCAEGDQVLALYRSGMSLSEVAQAVQLPKSTVRGCLVRHNALRTNKEGQELAAKKGRMSRYGPRPPFSDEARKNMSIAATKRAAATARGWRITSQGAVEITIGENAGKSEHTVIMERRLGRPLRPDECVHHIDRNKQNNSEDNLALVTNAGHGRLHRFEDKLAGIERRHKPNGQFAKETTK